MAPPRVPDYVLENASALDAVRGLYVSLPRAGTTAVPWALAGSEELTPERFHESEKLEVTRALTVHDPTRWVTGARLVGRGPK
jgi:hypothetical protein